jgi:hypothetical protein
VENNYGNILQRFVLRNFSYAIELIYPKCSYARQTDDSNLIRLPVIFDPGPYSLLDAVIEKGRVSGGCGLCCPWYG